MEREYKLSRVIIASLVAMISFVALINETFIIMIVGCILFSGIAVLMSFLGTSVSKKMIEVGDNISNNILRIMYYLMLFVILLVISILFYSVTAFLSETLFYSDDLAESLGQAILVLAIAFSFFIFVIIPYIQTILVLVLRKFMKSE